MQTGTLAAVVSMGSVLAGCGGGAACPEPSTPAAAPAPAPAAAPSPADGAPAEKAAAQLEGTYRILELRKGDEVVDMEKAFLAQAPSCYAARVLWRFRGDAFAASLDILCDGSEHTVDLCTASLEMGIRWSPGGLQFPVSARAGGVVDRFTLGFRQIPGGMRRTRDKVNRSCNVSVQASALTIKEKGPRLVLGTPDGDLVLTQETEPEVDWGKEAQRLYEERHGAR